MTVDLWFATVDLWPALLCAGLGFILGWVCGYTYRSFGGRQ